MGLFDHKNKSTVVSYSPKNEQEAWIAIMHACIAVDEDIADEELEELSQTLASLELFEGHDVREYYKTVLVAHAEIGSKHLIDNSVEFIAPPNKPALFTATIELVLADGLIAKKEEELISYLISALDLEVTAANQVVNNTVNRDRSQSNL